MRFALATVGSLVQAKVFERSGALLIAIAEGKQATSAQDVIDAVDTANDDDWSSLLLRVEDAFMPTRCASTAVIVRAEPGLLAGTAVGNSSAWWVDELGVEDLTEKQHATLVGQGCHPYSFRIRGLENGTLLVATRALFEHAMRDDIVRIARGEDLEKAAQALAQLPGDKAHDLAVVLAR